jgi:hypothetical protein
MAAYDPAARPFWEQDAPGPIDLRMRAHEAAAEAVQREKDREESEYRIMSLASLTVCGTSGTSHLARERKAQLNEMIKEHVRLYRQHPLDCRGNRIRPKK